MARTKFTSPTLELRITAEQHERAVQSASGGCLIADAIREQYPHLTKVTVDMATIRASDRKTGKRYTYLTPPIAQHLLLAFDQGWPQPTEQLVVKRAVKITPITRNRTGRASSAGAAARREARIAELEAKVAAGEELTVVEKKALTRMRNAKPAPERPASRGPTEVHVTSNRGAVVHGGKAIPQGEAHPNLLRGRDRHFGAKLADPGIAFREAVEAAVADRLAKVEGDATA
jgi:hypothetical protein